MSWKNDRSWKIWLVCHFCIQVLKVCLSSSVLATAAIGFKTKEKKRVYHIDRIVCWRQHHRHLRQWETPNIAIWEGHTLMIRILQLVTCGGSNTCMPLPYIYLIPKLISFRPLLPIADFLSWLHYHKEENCCWLHITSLWWKRFITLKAVAKVKKVNFSC